MTNKFNFTNHVIERLTTPKTGKRSYFRDTKVFGLELMITDTGAKSFKVYRKIGGRPIRVTLGKFPEISVEQARKRAVKVNYELSEGLNPNHEKHKTKSEDTFKQLFGKYIDQHAKLRNKTWKADVADVNDKLGNWMHRKISSISHNETKRLITQVADESGLHAANRLMDRINAIFNWGIGDGWKGENPAKGISKFPVQSRDRFIQPDEFPAFFKALDNEQSEIARDYILLSLLTGARKTNILTMRWSDINFVMKQWRIPETKNGEPLTLPLVDAATEILRRRSFKNQNQLHLSPYVFPGSGKAGHLADPKKAWQRVVSAAGLKNLRLHDLRRSLGSYQAILGANSYTIGKSLGHKSQTSTAIYARLNMDPVRASMQAATTKMLELQNG